jgi:hypothetical protein
MECSHRQQALDLAQTRPLIPPSFKTRAQFKDRVQLSFFMAPRRYRVGRPACVSFGVDDISEEWRVATAVFRRARPEDEDQQQQHGSLVFASAVLRITLRISPHANLFRAAYSWYPLDSLPLFPFKTHSLKYRAILLVFFESNPLPSPPSPQRKCCRMVHGNDMQ